MKNSVSIFFTDKLCSWIYGIISLSALIKEVHKLEAEFKQCRKLLNAIGDENRQHLICVMMNMPIDGGLVLEIVEQTHHQGCHSLI